MKKIIALLLCLVMLFSLSSVAMAATPTAVPTKAEYVSKIVVYLHNLIQHRISDAADRYINGINYVALGDSTSMGYYVGDAPHFSYSYQHNADYPSSEYSQYTLFMNYLTGKYPTMKITGTDLSLPGFRPIMLRGILEQDEFD